MKAVGGSDIAHCYEQWIQYIRMQFENRNKRPREKQVFAHLGCAIDMSSIEKVFDDIHHIVINTSLVRGSGPFP